MGAGLSEEVLRERRLDIMTIGWTLLKAEIAAVEMPQYNSGSNCKGPSPGNSSLNRTS
jgi:hypothetical protein